MADVRNMRLSLDWSKIDLLRGQSMSLERLAELMDMSPRAVADWRKKGHTTFENAEKLALALEVGVLDICTSVPPEIAKHVESSLDYLSADPGKHPASKVVVANRRGFRFYARNIGFFGLLVRGWVKRFRHEGTIRHSYVTLTVRPSEPSVRSVFVFSFFLGRFLRIDHGEVVVESGQLFLDAYFAPCKERGVVASDGSFRVRTWFGAENCRFMLRCRETRFDVELNIPQAVDHRPTHPDPDVLTFPAAPHHLRAAEEAGIVEK